MPRPLATLPKTDRDLYAALAQDPLATDTPEILGDRALDQGQEHRSVLLRQQETGLAFRELLRGNALDEQDCAAVLAADPAERDRLIGQFLGTSEAHAFPDLRTSEGIRSQYDFQRLLLASLDLLEDHNGQLGITGIDGQFHPLPTLDILQSRLTSPELMRKIEQGFDTLLLVPFALPLTRLIEAWKRCLLRNEHLFEPYGRLNRAEPITWVNVYDSFNGRGPDEVDYILAYSPQRFSRGSHGSRTKAELLDDAPHAGWQTLLVEGSLHDIPYVNQGKSLGGRPQIEAYLTPQEYLASLPAGESGWTPETYIAVFLTQLERSGRPLDIDSATCLIGSYLRGPGEVPVASWLPSARQAFLLSSRPDEPNHNFGARAAVRVL